MASSYLLGPRIPLGPPGCGRRLRVQRPRADWPEGARELEITFFIVVIVLRPSFPLLLPSLCLSSPLPQPPSPLPPPPPPAQLKERGSDAAASFIWGNSWLPRVYYPRRSQCLARRTRRAKHRGSGAEQYPPRARRRDLDSGGGSGRPRAQREGARPPPAAPAPPRWSGGAAGARDLGDKRGARLRPFLARLPGPRTASALGHRGPAAAPISFCGSLLSLPGPGSVRRRRE